MVQYNKTGGEGSELYFVSFDNTATVGETANFPFKVEVGNLSDTEDLDVEVKAFLYVSGVNDESIVSSTSTVVTENDIVEGTLSHIFPENDNNAGETRKEKPIWIKAEIRYLNNYGYPKDDTVHTATTMEGEVSVNPETDESRIEQFDSGGPVNADNTLASTFVNRTPFSIKQIEFEEDATYVDSIFDETEYTIDFDYPNPSVAIDGAGRFAKHEIIGGSTVRQKIGEDPINISINGVCKRNTANKIDSLRDAKNGNIYSDRLPGASDSLRVQFGSTSTQPMEDGGSADLKDGRYLYTFQINAIEVIR